MPKIGIRELKTKASEIVRRVQEERERYTVTHRGQPVAVIVPIERGRNEIAGDADAAATWDELLNIGEEISSQWTSQQTSLEILSDMRR
ncbi:MAG: type II toxin-antitoxin system Phd/YefM family antitoxin [Chloroflexi bacterium]|nr:MAG: type II toxin-antitoxin system Phd/YefM family antitoxin [Chloroflexota bacterium]